MVQIDAAGNGGYDGDVCASGVANLTIEGVNGRARIDAAGQSSGGKAIWVLSGAGTVVRNVELSGAKVPDRNGAGIRLEGGSLTLVGSSLHDNEDGILVGNVGTIDLTIEGSEFSNNGYGDGYSHNIYVGAIHRFTMRYSASRGAKVGHLVKSRAAINDISYNRLTGESSTDSYEIDLPNGGRSNLVGNIIEQGPKSENPTLLAYGLEGASNADSQLTVVNNTFVNDRPGNATAVNVDGSVTSPAIIANNIAVGTTTVVTQGSASLSGNCLVADPAFVDRNVLDYHLREGSPCREIGDPAPAGGSGLPTEQYVYDLGHEPRATYGTGPDAGAFEWAPAGSGGGGALPTPAPGGGTTTTKSPLSVTAQRVRRDGSLRLTVKVTGAGRVSATARARIGATKRITYASGAARRARRAGTLTLTLKPTRIDARTLRRKHRLTLTVTTTFRPTSGAKAATRTTTLKLRRTAAAVRRG
ncbi:hypothetical protein [Baekduia sp. Peel2402]|uniref:hypothetical protein n=1 Tax=Baekduia sp. Peel2402 TaxID=3458296 RepID=UPI00403E7A55